MKNNMQRVIGNIVILTPVIVGLVFYKQLPNQIAIHFNVEEQANGFMNPTEQTFILLQKASASALSSHQSSQYTALHPSHYRTARSCRLHKLSWK